MSSKKQKHAPPPPPAPVAAPPAPVEPAVVEEPVVVAPVVEPEPPASEEGPDTENFLDETPPEAPVEEPAQPPPSEEPEFIAPEKVTSVEVPHPHPTAAVGDVVVAKLPESQGFAWDDSRLKEVSPFCDGHLTPDEHIARALAEPLKYTLIQPGRHPVKEAICSIQRIAYEGVERWICALAAETLAQLKASGERLVLECGRIRAPSNAFSVIALFLVDGAGQVPTEGWAIDKTCNRVLFFQGGQLAFSATEEQIHSAISSSPRS